MDEELPVTFDQIVTVTIKPGTEADFLAAAAGLAAGVAAGEPDTLEYRLYKVRDKADTFMFVESYTDEAALDTHRKNPETQKFFAVVGQCLAGRPVVDVVEPV